MARITLNNVTKSYGDGSVAVRSVSLDIADREFVVLVGPSGCGKSTTLRMIAGLEDVTGGTISIDDRVVNAQPARERNVAMVFQNYALYPHLPVFENMAFGLRLRNTPQAEVEQRVGEAARVLGLETLLERLPRALSGGQRQRVAMGRAIVRRPNAFLFDEPLSNLDAELRMAMRGEIKRVHKAVDTTTIYVTHDQVEAMTLADRVVVMRGGEVQQIAPPRLLYEEPANKFVAGFIGSPGMNFFPALLEEAVPELRLDGGERLALPASLADRCAAYRGRKVILGVRPEHLTLASDVARGPVGSVPAHVSLVEPLGAEAILHATIAGSEALSRTTSNCLPGEGEAVTLSVRLDQIKLFDAETGRAIWR
jgi:multiple sugar transport system ATP-binding protein